MANTTKTTLTLIELKLKNQLSRGTQIDFTRIYNRDGRTAAIKFAVAKIQSDKDRAAGRPFATVSIKRGAFVS